ncbi:MAG: hypothetical protein KFW21_05935 [Spirochaetota bacterium]|nr:hypothetical protein [Spirochaetota bacterium]
MIIAIQQHLKEVLINSSSIAEEMILIDTPDPNLARPWISILPSKATLSPAWYWDNQYYESTPHGKFLVKIQRKYNIIQPIVINFEFIDKSELDDIVHNFLVQLPKEFIIQHSVISLSPIDLEYFFAKGVLGFNTAQLSLHANYAIRSDNTDNTIIKDVTVNVTPSK